MKDLDAGAEAISSIFDVRANYYDAISGRRKIQKVLLKEQWMVGILEVIIIYQLSQR